MADTQQPQQPQQPNVVTVAVPPVEGTYFYVAVKGSLHATDSSVFGLNRDEAAALAKRFSNTSIGIVNGISIKGSPMDVINSLGQLGYKVVCSTGETEVIWTMTANFKIYHEMSEHKHENGVCNCKSTVAAQSLTEMDFDRGIWSAALYNDIDRLKELINRGHTNNRDETGYTALHYAARNNNITACELLIKASANVNAATNGGVTPLQRAAMMGHIDIVKLLLSHRADVTVQDSDGNTAAHRAGQNGHINIVHLLMQSDKNLANCLNNRGQTPLDVKSN